MNGRYYVGEWLVEPEQNRLVRGSETAKLDPKAIQVLSFLAEHPNEVLTKEQIFAAVWDGAFVSDEVLTTAIWGLRKALGDDAKEPRYIQTIPRRGYRLIAPVEGATAETSRRWEPSPYPGLSAFSQRDAAYFFGREQEVEALWTKIHERNLLGLIGPSGAGKSSLLRAGLIPAAPEGWDVVLCQPRSDALDRLAAALEQRGSENARSLWVVDQFEELFTLHDEETQKRFADLLGRAAASGVHVLLSMRDDFLMSCHDHPALEPVFEKLTPVKAPEGAALRRVLNEPARMSGYRFEDEALVAEILAEVGRERGALPLLAFAASKLWEKRDREGRLLTREAYRAIGGVAGALAQHAEETLSSLGPERERIVREIFRNLTTASGTRVPMDREELLTVFPDREEAPRVLGKLIDARLLTWAGREIEVTHESLLSAWPRLVRWQAQDAEGAVLRDQLRQAARAWHERGRPPDLLWTGTSYRELAVWRERYGGGLTASEEEFARAMSALASRKRRRRRIAVSAVVFSLTIGLAIMGALWKKSETQALRAEASKLLALGQLQVERHPTGALAYAIKSLELADSEEARRFALKVLQGGSVGRRSRVPGIEGLETMTAAFSPDGEWLAIGGYRSAQLRHRDGREPIILQGEYPTVGNRWVGVAFAPDGRTLVTSASGDLRWWSVPEGRLIRQVQLDGTSLVIARRAGVYTTTPVGATHVIRAWSSDEGRPAWEGSTAAENLDIDGNGERLVYSLGRTVYLRSLDRPVSGPELIAEHSASVRNVRFHPSGDRVAVSDETGRISIWPIPKSEHPLRILGPEEGTGSLLFSPNGRWLAVEGEKNRLWVVRVWDLSAPEGAAPLEIRADSLFLNAFEFDPTETWLVTTHADHTSYWPLGAVPRRLDGLRGRVNDVEFTPDGSTLLSVSSDGTLRAWPLDPENGSKPRILLETSMGFPRIAVDSGGGWVALTAGAGRVLVVPLDGGPARELEGFSKDATTVAVDISPDGRLVAVAPQAAPVAEKFIHVWELESGLLRMKLPIPGAGDGFQGAITAISFLDENHLLVGSAAYPSGGLDPPVVLYDLREGSRKELSNFHIAGFVVNSTGRFGFGTDEGGNVIRFQVDDETWIPVRSHLGAFSLALSRSETLLASGSDDTVRVGPVSGEEPHLLLGHSALIRSLAFSPDGRWLASSGEDKTVRLWPVPDVTKTPPHRIPREEFLSILRSWTNLRVVRDESAPTGWRLDAEPFPGWAEFPIPFE